MTDLERLLEEVRGGRVPVAEAARRLACWPCADLGFARVDRQRAARCGFPEVVFCPGKTPEDVAAIAVEILASGHDLLATRADAAQARAVQARVPEAVFHERARCVAARRSAPAPEGLVAVVCAGTADLPVAEEARVTAETLGARVEAFCDVGVAGLHRLLGTLEGIRKARAVVAVAGMEGALPSVVGGLVSVPVVAVPTSVGYGTGFGGLAAVLAMLNSCSPNVCVVNIDNGFGAGVVAALVNRGGTAGEPRSLTPPRS
jgi:NCAIR mutase (PurE)-related protein